MCENFFVRNPFRSSECSRLLYTVKRLQTVRILIPRDCVSCEIPA
jgi:hypothetical protein